MKRLFFALLAMMMLSAQAFAANSKAPAASGDSLPTMSLMMCKDCPMPAAGQPAAMTQGEQGAAMTPMSAGCSMFDAFGTIVDVMKMQQKLIASGPGLKKKKEVAEIDRKIAEIEGMITKMKNSPMPCPMGAGAMQGMPCMQGQPCPNMPQPPAK